MYVWNMLSLNWLYIQNYSILFICFYCYGTRCHVLTGWWQILCTTCYCRKWRVLVETNQTKCIFFNCWVSICNFCFNLSSKCSWWALVFAPPVVMRHVMCCVLSTLVFKWNLWNHRANFNQASQEWSFDGPRPKFYKWCLWGLSCPCHYWT